MVVVAMVTKVQKMLNSLQASQMFAVLLFLRCFMKFDERNKKIKKNTPFFISMATAAKFHQKEIDET
jgi:hypothetical protein